MKKEVVEGGDIVRRFEFCLFLFNIRGYLFSIRDVIKMILLMKWVVIKICEFVRNIIELLVFIWIVSLVIYMVLTVFEFLFL